MKSIFSLLALTLLVICSFAQSSETAPGDSIPWEIRKQSFVYNTAKIFNDPVVARTALYNLLAENPGNVSLYDSLSLLYLQYNQYASAALVSQQSLQIQPKNEFAMEVAAVSFDNLGVKDKAINNYEKLYLAQGNINVLYKIGFLQYETKRFAEANTSLDIIIGDPKSETINVRFPTEDGAGQEASLKVAAIRIKAMILQAQGKKDEAKAKFLEVLEMQPGLQIVQQQLRELTKPAETATDK